MKNDIIYFVAEWLEACRILFVIGMALTALSVVVIAIGLTTKLFHRKIKYYIIGMVFLVLAGKLKLQKGRYKLHSLTDPEIHKDKGRESVCVCVCVCVVGRGRLPA